MSPPPPPSLQHPVWGKGVSIPGRCQKLGQRHVYDRRVSVGQVQDNVTAWVNGASFRSPLPPSITGGFQWVKARTMLQPQPGSTARHSSPPSALYNRRVSVGQVQDNVTTWVKDTSFLSPFPPPSTTGGFQWVRSRTKSQPGSAARHSPHPLGNQV